jgi:hypothetical protein
MNEESRRGFLQRFTEGLTSGSIEESRIGRALDFLVEQFGEAGILIALVALVSETNKDHLVQINIVPVDTWAIYGEVVSIKAKPSSIPIMKNDAQVPGKIALVLLFRCSRVALSITGTSPPIPVPP